MKNRSDYVETHTQYAIFNGDAWSILSDIELRIKSKVESIGLPLKEWNVQIYRGILTGCNNAFVITSKERDEILANCTSEKERQKTAEIIRPILRGRDIKKYEYDWSNLWLIWVPWHFPYHLDTLIKGASEKAEKAFRTQYSAIYDHLYKYKEQLLARNKAETGIRYEWYALQRWGANYWDLFSKPKIVWGEISDRSKFCIDDTGSYYPEATTFMLSGDNLYLLLAFLNCSVSEYFFSTIGTTTGVGTIRWKKYKILELVVPNKLTSSQVSEIENLCYKVALLKKTNSSEAIEVERQLNHLIYNIYSLTEDEINYIEQAVS